MVRVKSSCIWAALLCLGLGGADLAQAEQPASSDIVVTARRRDEPLLRTPGSASVRSGEDLNASGVHTVSGLLPEIPNASLAGGIGGELQGLSSVRGVSSLVRVVGIESGLGVYVDGVFVGRPDSFNLNLFGAERVELLRGPQQTFFGRNAIAGVINIVTPMPDEHFHAAAQFGVGDYNLLRLQTYASGQIADDLYGSVALQRVTRDGVVEHAGGGRNLDDLDNGSYRIKLRATPTPTLEATLTFDGLVDHGHPAFFEVSDAILDDPSLHSPFTVNNDQDNHLYRHADGLSLQLRQQIGAGALISTTSYRQASFDAALDDDKLPAHFVEDVFGDDTDIASQEFRYESAANQAVRYMLGGSYFHQRVTSFRPFAIGDFLTGTPGLIFPITLKSEATTEAYDIFGNVDMSLSHRLDLSLGGRLMRERRHGVLIQRDPVAHIFPNLAFDGSTDDDFASWTAALSYSLSPSVQTYLRYARGFKSAGFNTDFSQSTDDIIVKPETADSIELGFKARYASGRGLLTAALFSTAYRDMQVSQIAANAVELRNAASASIWGAELESRYQGEHWDLNAALGYLDARYDEFDDCPAPAGARASEVRPECSGDRLIISPRWTASASVERRFSSSLGGEWFVRGQANFQSAIYFEPQNTYRLSGDARSVLDLRAGYRSGAWEAALWINNASDELYVTYADDRSVIGIPTTRAYGEPRTFGLTLRRSWGGAS